MHDHGVRMRLAALAAGAALVSGVSLWPLIGHAAAYLTLIFCLASLVLQGRPRALLDVTRAAWSIAFLVAFALIAFAFLLQPDHPSLAFIPDFAVFALAPLVGAGLAPLAERSLTIARVSQLCLLAAGLAALIGLHGMWQGYDRPTAPGVSPIHFADLAVVLGFMALAGTLADRGRGRWIYYLGPVLAILATIAAETRGALLVALGLALLYGVIRTAESALPRPIKLLLPLSFGVIVIAGFALAYALGFTRPLEAFQPVIALLRGELPADTSALYRVEMYRAGLLAFADAPLFGHGWHEQIGAAMPYLSPVGREGYALESWGYIHNDALSLAVAAGLCGLVAYGLMLGAPLLAHFRSPGGPDRKARLYAALCLSVGIFLSGATDVLLMVEMPKILLVLGAATLYWFGPRETDGAHA